MNPEFEFLIARSPLSPQFLDGSTLLIHVSLIHMHISFQILGIFSIVVHRCSDYCHYSRSSSSRRMPLNLGFFRLAGFNLSRKPLFLFPPLKEIGVIILGQKRMLAHHVYLRAHVQDGHSRGALECHSGGGSDLEYSRRLRLGNRVAAEPGISDVLALSERQLHIIVSLFSRCCWGYGTGDLCGRT